MEIRGTNSMQAAQAVRMPNNVSNVDTANQVSMPDVVDQLDISAEAQAASKLSEAADVRSMRVAEIRSQIADGTYETQGKLDAAVNRMLDEVI